MKEIASRVGNASLRIHAWPGGKVSLEVKPHEGVTDCEAARGSVGLYPKDVRELVNYLRSISE